MKYFIIKCVYICQKEGTLVKIPRLGVGLQQVFFPFGPIINMVYKSMHGLLRNQKPKLANPCYSTVSLVCVEHGWKPLSILFWLFSAFAGFQSWVGIQFEGG